jgi:hypothetical protein
MVPFSESDDGREDGSLVGRDMTTALRNISHLLSRRGWGGGECLFELATTVVGYLEGGTVFLYREGAMGSN